MRVNSNEVEELSDSQWQRIESQVFLRKETRETAGKEAGEKASLAKPWIFGSGLGAMALSFALALFVIFPNVLGKSTTEPIALRVVTDEQPVASVPVVEVQRPPSSGLSVQPQELVSKVIPRKVTVGLSRVELTPWSSLQVSGSPSSSRLVRVVSGRATFRVQPHEPRAPFVVQALEVKVTVVGTRFSVDVSNGVPEIHVFEGIVKVSKNEVVHVLRQGDSYPPDTSATSVPAKEPAQKRKRRSARLRRVPSSGQLFARAAALERKQPARASKIYASLSRKGGPVARNALYARALLELDRRNKTLALELLHTYSRKFPRGANHRDVNRLLLTLKASKTTP